MKFEISGTGKIWYQKWIRFWVAFIPETERNFSGSVRGQFLGTMKEKKSGWTPPGQLETKISIPFVTNLHFRSNQIL